MFHHEKIILYRNTTTNSHYHSFIPFIHLLWNILVILFSFNFRCRPLLNSTFRKLSIKLHFHFKLKIYSTIVTLTILRLSDSTNALYSALFFVHPVFTSSFENYCIFIWPEYSNIFCCCQLHILILYLIQTYFASLDVWIFFCWERITTQKTLSEAFFCCIGRKEEKKIRISYHQVLFFFCDDFIHKIYFCQFNWSRVKKLSNVSDKSRKSIVCFHLKCKKII